jgi:hypothetical protein
MNAVAQLDGANWQRSQLPFHFANFAWTTELKTDSSLHDEASNCLDCGAAVSAHFCPVCGQETRLHVPSAREFLHEFVGHYVALEGKLWKTLGLLLFRPGRLTAEYIAGRRARYVQPLRLYLTLSILFFALLKYGPADIELKDNAAAGKAAVSSMAKVVATPARGNTAAPSAAIPDDSADGFHLETGIGEFNPAWEARLKQIEAMPAAERKKLIKNIFFSYVPYAMFCMMPLFALYLKLLYLGSGRRYGEHLLFALHSNAVAFALFGLIRLAGWDWLRYALVIWLALYLPVAMRRVYGGGWLATGLRWVVLMSVHQLGMAAAIIATMALALLS